MHGMDRDVEIVQHDADGLVAAVVVDVPFGLVGWLVALLVSQ